MKRRRTESEWQAAEVKRMHNYGIWEWIGWTWAFGWDFYRVLVDLGFSFLIPWIFQHWVFSLLILCFELVGTGIGSPFGLRTNKMSHLDDSLALYLALQ
jgi:hypothetical protein